MKRARRVDRKHELGRAHQIEEAPFPRETKL